MEIHVVRQGETVASIAQQYGVPISRVLTDNQLPGPGELAIGQTLVIQFPALTHTVKPEETLYSVAEQYGVSIRQLRRNNPALQGGFTVYPGQTLVIEYTQEKQGTLSSNGYVYPFVNRNLLSNVLPYLTAMAPFTYGFTAEGDLIELDDEALIRDARANGVAPMMHLSTLTEEGRFSSELGSLVLTNAEVQDALVGNILTMIQEKNYAALDVDFEYLPGRDAAAYAAFLRRLREQLNPLGKPVIAALAPKTSSSQKGLLYEAHDYAAIAWAANQVLLMTYEWGYAYSEPKAVAPLPNVRAVVEYALTQMKPEKIWLGIPNYGYDWALPWVKGRRAVTISNQYAVSQAIRYGASIQYDEVAQTPWFRYRDESGTDHEVWFEDARSIRAKLSLIPQYSLYGVGYWNVMRPFPQNWLVLNSLYHIRDADTIKASIL